MNPFNKYETVGVLLSIGAMALVLAAVRFNPNTPVLSNSIDSQSQIATVVSSAQDIGNAKLEAALRDASTSKGDLMKLVIDDVKVGTGIDVRNGDTVTVNYIGTTQDGVRFDSSYDRGQPFVFTVGAGKVIQGWEKGLIGMKVGGQRILVIPADMAYGNKVVGSIPANSPLVFTIELMSVK